MIFRRICATRIFFSPWSRIENFTHPMQGSSTCQKRPLRNDCSWTDHDDKKPQGCSAYRVVRYTERNAMWANLVTKAKEWPWGSLWIRQFGSPKHHAMLSGWPLPRPRKWLQYINEPETESELEAIRRSCRRRTPHESTN